MDVLNLDDSNFDSALAASGAKLVVVDFWADWCTPCKALKPIVDKFAAEHPSVQVVKVDANVALKTVTRFGVTNLPTVLFLRQADSEPVAEVRGNVTRRLLDARYEDAESLVR